MLRSILFLLGTSFLAACTLPVVHPDFTGLPKDADPKTFRCCEDPERQPTWFADLARDFSEPLAPIFAAGAQEGFLMRYPDAQQRLRDEARPLDLMTLSSKSLMSSRMLPGWFTHSAVYLGTEAQLRAEGLWDDPRVVGFQADIRQGRVIVEGVAGGVRMATWDVLLHERDAVALMRPAIQPSEKRVALSNALSLVGTEFDYYYDIESCDRLACSEVLCRSFPSLSFPIRDTYGTKVLLPDDIAANAIRGDDMRLIDYIRADARGWDAAGLKGAMTDVAAFWGPMEVAPRTPVIGSQELGTCTLPNG